MPPAIARHFSLRGRLSLLLLAAFAALAGVIVWHSLADRDERLRTTSEQLLAEAKLVAARQQSIVAKADAILTGLMLRPELRPDAAAGDCSLTLARRLKLEAAFLNMGKVLPDGEVACSAVPAKDRVNVTDRFYFQQALKTQGMVVGDVMTGRLTGKPVIVFAKAMRDEAGRVSAVLFAALDLEWVRRELAEVALLEGARVVVVDGLGAVAMRHPDPEGWAGRSIAHLPLFQRILAHGGEGTLEDIGLDGVRKIYGFTPLLHTASGRMTLWLSLPKAEVEAPVRRELLFNLAIALAVLISTLGLVIWGGNQLVIGPILTLSRTAARFGTGNLGVRTGLPHGVDEIGRLARTLDEMADAIEDRERRLARANRALRVLSAGNRALLHCKTEQELTEEMCRSLVEAGGYLLAWVGYAGHDRDKRVRPVASWNAADGFFDGLTISWDETETGQGTIGTMSTAIRRGIPIASNNILTDPDYAPWRERAQRYGYAASLALPLRLEGTTIGALNIYAAEPDAFDKDVVELLSEAAADLAFGIATQRGEAEHDRTRAELQTAAQRFRETAEASLDALFILKCVRGERGDILDFEFTDLNVRAEQMLGMARGQVVGQKLCELLPFNRTGGFFDKYVAVATTGTPLEEEFPIDTPEIKAKWLRHQVVQVGDGIAISSRDVTVWKEVGATLRESEKRFRDIVGVSADWIWETDAEGRYTYASENVKDLLGYTSEEVIGRTPFDFMPPEEAARVGAIFAAIAAWHEPFRDLDNINLHKDGSLRHVQTSGIPILDDGGSLLGYRGLDKDITGKKLAELALARASRALRTLSAANEALVRAASEEGLLNNVTRIIVDIGGYRLATVGYADDNPEKSLRRVALAGAGEDFFPGEPPTWADAESGQAPIARAIRSGMPQICHDIAGDPGFAPWKDAALAQGYASNIGLPLSDDRRTFGGLSIYSSDKDAFDDEEARLLTELANDLAFGIATLRTRAERDRIAHAHEHHAEILQKSLEQSIQAIADTVEARDPYTAGHQRRVSELAVAIAREMGLPEQKIHGIHLAAIIHDLGKIHVPAEILSKPSKLSDIEFMLIKTHPQAGYDILKGIEFPWPIADIVRQHHEKLDGSGYPQGLKGGQILLESRIMTVADVVEAMASHRPYRAALGIEVALKEIERGKGSAYDVAVADACLKLFREGRFSFQV